MKSISIVKIIIFLTFLASLLWVVVSRVGFYPNDDTTEDGVDSVSVSEVALNDTGLKSKLVMPQVSVVAEDLEIPWSVSFLPNRDMLVTERAGRLVRITPLGKRTFIGVPDVFHRGEGGLLGLATSPNFFENNLIYLYITTNSKEGTLNRVAQYELKDNTLLNEKILIDDIPGARFHNGGRILFGPDGMLYITTGDGTDPDTAQNINSLGGKILRINEDGSIPESNLFGTAVYSYGHRNPQGLAWDDRGRLWSTEHGRSGVKSGLDELNLIESGANYGWPIIQGNEEAEKMVTPALHSGPDVTWAPASALYWEGSIFFGGLRGEALYEVPITQNSVGELVRHFFQEHGRIRDTVLGPDGMFYITTSNRDGRGDIRVGDDKIIKIDPKIFR